MHVGVGVGRNPRELDGKQPLGESPQGTILIPAGTAGPWDPGMTYKMVKTDLVYIYHKEFITHLVSGLMDISTIKLFFFKRHPSKTDMRKKKKNNLPAGPQSSPSGSLILTS